MAHQLTGLTQNSNRHFVRLAFHKCLQRLAGWATSILRTLLNASLGNGPVSIHVLISRHPHTQNSGPRSSDAHWSLASVNQFLIGSVQVARLSGLFGPP